MKVIIVDTGAGFLKKKVDEDYDLEKDPDYLSALNSGKSVRRPWVEGQEPSEYVTQNIDKSDSEPNPNFVKLDGQGFELKAFIIGVFDTCIYLWFFGSIIYGFILGGNAGGFNNFNLGYAVLGGGVGLIVGAVSTGFFLIVSDIRAQLIKLGSKEKLEEE